MGSATLSTEETTVSPHANTVSAGAAGPPPLDRLIRGVLVGRYIVIDRIGAGGMGEVYAAYDPELNRKVALKLLLPGGGPEQQPRLLLEAQAMARLSHPNICAVHDVGTSRRQSFIAMEFVAGVTLRAWLAQRRAWEDIVQVLLAVGRGIAAAHAVGIVHSDLKPENVMIAADGRPRVMDFGIARADRSAHAEDATLSGFVDPTLEGLTEPGSVRGTPPYMAPEQWRTRETSTLSDQYSYCVMAWEALFGERPFADEAARIADGQPLRPRPTPSSARVPAWVRRTLLRGLAGRPGDRFPTMDALLDELGAAQVRRRWAWLAAAAAAGALVLGGAAGVRSWQEQRHVAACEAAGASLGAEVWTDEARERMMAALVAAQLPDAGSAGTRVAGWIDGFMARWQQVRSEACVAGDERPDACLEDQRQRLALLLATMAGTTDRGTMSTAIHMAAALPDPRTCDDPVLAQRSVAVEGAEAQALAASLRQDLRRGAVLAAMARPDEADPLLQRVIARAEGAGLRALVIEAKLEAGVNADRAADYATAERLLKEAMREAGASGLDVLAIEAASQLVRVVGLSLARHAEGLLIGEFAEMLVRRLGQTDRPLHARLLLHVAAVQHRAGAVREALVLSERAQEILRRELGTAHPDLAIAVDQAASLHKDLGEHREALARYKDALAVAVALYGPHSDRTAAIQGNMGTMYLFLGERAEALVMARQSLATYEGVFEAGHPDIARARSNLANVLAANGDTATAIAEHHKALASFEAALGPMHRDLAGLLHDLAFAQFHAGDRAGAERSLRRALSIWEATLAADDPRIAALLNALGDVLVNSGRAEEGLGMLERSVRIGEARGEVPERLADARNALAKAVWAVRRDKAEALAIAGQAVAVYRAAGPPRAEFLAELEAWMRAVEHGTAR